MKKFIAIPLLVLYLTAISGMMVQFHFCGSRLSSWNVNQPKASCCCSDEAMPAKSSATEATKIAFGADDDCCSNKTITLKIAQDQNAAHGISMPLSVLQVAVLPAYTVPVLSKVIAPVTGTAYQANAPPGLWQGIPLYKLHSRFTYYG